MSNEPLRVMSMEAPQPGDLMWYADRQPLAPLGEVKLSLHCALSRIPDSDEQRLITRGICSSPGQDSVRFFIPRGCDCGHFLPATSAKVVVEGVAPEHLRAVAQRVRSSVDGAEDNVHRELVLAKDLVKHYQTELDTVMGRRQEE